MTDKIKYNILASTVDNGGQTSDRAFENTPYQLLNRRCFRISSTYALVILFALASATAFFLGRSIERSQAQSDWLLPPGRKHDTFQYQQLFSSRPDNLSDANWASLFPDGDGFIQHPEYSPSPGCLAVYHQLHCLNAIRHGYWAAKDGRQPDHHASHAHILHCIDYLRQSIMCLADTNIEPVRIDLGGVTGFASLKTCKEISRVKQWASDWASHRDSTIKTE